MKTAVIGAGAIGCVAGALMMDAGHDVTLVGRAGQVAAINGGGLVIDGELGGRRFEIPAGETLDFEPELVLLAVKTHDVEEALKDAVPRIGGAPVVTMQNGVRSDTIAAGVVGGDRVVSTVVMFGATYESHGRVTYNFPGGLVAGHPFPGGEGSMGLARAALRDAFELHESQDIHGAHWTKLILNLNNAVAAALGTSLQEAFSDARTCELGVRMMKEAYDVMAASGVSLGPLPGLPLTRLESLLFAPTEVSSEVYGGIMRGLSSAPLPGSVLQSIKRGRPTEVEYINGEVAALAQECGLAAPLNEKICMLVRRVEKTGRFIDKEALLEKLALA